MAKPLWRDRLRDELHKRGLPRAYATRLIQELTEHLADIRQQEPSMKSEPKSAEDALGSPERIAAAAAHELGRRTFAGRHPFVTFVLSPLPLITLLVAVIVLIGRAWGWLITPREVHAPTTLERFSAFLEMCLLCLSPFLVAWLFLEMGRRAARPVWGLATCGFLAFVALNFTPTITPGFEVYLSAGGFLLYHPDRLIQTALPLALALWAWWRMHYPPKNSACRSDAEPTSASGHA
jgi:hypothetical protein